MMRQMAGRYIPGDSVLHNIIPSAKLFSFILIIAAVIFTNTVVGYGAMVAFTVCVVLYSNTPIEGLIKSIAGMLPFFAVIFVMNSLFYSSDNPIWKFWFITLSKEGMIQGLNVVFRIAIIIIISGVLTQTTSTMGLMSGIETLIKPLKYIRVPVEEVAMILSVALQFIPTLIEESDKIKKAQIARGARFESEKLSERAMAMLPMIVPLFLSSFKRADELSMAMESRGYRGAKGRTPKARESLDRLSVMSIIACAALCALEVII